MGGLFFFFFGWWSEFLGRDGWFWNPLDLEDGVVLMEVVIVEGLLREKGAYEVLERD